MGHVHLLPRGSVEGGLLETFVFLGSGVIGDRMPAGIEAGFVTGIVSGEYGNDERQQQDRGGAR
jgi:hypothetical protein